MVSKTKTKPKKTPRPSLLDRIKGKIAETETATVDNYLALVEAVAMKREVDLEAAQDILTLNGLTADDLEEDSRRFVQRMHLQEIAAGFAELKERAVESGREMRSQHAEHTREQEALLKKHRAIEQELSGEHQTHLREFHAAERAKQDLIRTIDRLSSGRMAAIENELAEIKVKRFELIKGRPTSRIAPGTNMIVPIAPPDAVGVLDEQRDELVEELAQIRRSCMMPNPNGEG